MNYGDEGDLYYIILEGEVIVRIPQAHILEEEQFSPLGLLMFLIEYYNDIMWSMLNHGDTIKELLFEALKKVGFNPSDKSVVTNDF